MITEDDLHDAATELAAYLRTEAARVRVDDPAVGLAEIEAGVARITVARRVPRRRWPVVLVGAAASITLVAGVLGGSPAGGGDGEVGSAAPAVGLVPGAAPVGDPGGSGPGAPEDTSTADPSPATSTPASTPGDDPVIVGEPVPVDPTAARVPLPDGATMQGFTPSCTTADEIVYECTIPGHGQPGGYPDQNMVGMAQAIIDQTSHVSGGCRSTSADMSTWLCYIGQRAVDEQLIGENFLGEWASPGYAAG